MPKVLSYAPRTDRSTDRARIAIVFCLGGVLPALLLPIFVMYPPTAWAEGRLEEYFPPNYYQSTVKRSAMCLAAASLVLFMTVRFRERRVALFARSVIAVLLIGASYLAIPILFQMVAREFGLFWLICVWLIAYPVAAAWWVVSKSPPPPHLRD
jgi:hypothetical protein